MNEYNLNSDFDINKHAQTFINYLEIIILEEGTIKYAVPSHQEFLINYCMKLKGITDRWEFYDLCPREYSCDYMTWLCKESNCIAVWDRNYIGEPNDKQKERLLELKQKGLYKGKVIE